MNSISTEGQGPGFGADTLELNPDFDILVFQSQKNGSATTSFRRNDANDTPLVLGTEHVSERSTRKKKANAIVTSYTEQGTLRAEGLCTAHGLLSPTATLKVRAQDVLFNGSSPIPVLLQALPWLMRNLIGYFLQHFPQEATQSKQYEPAALPAP